MLLQQKGNEKAGGPGQQQATTMKSTILGMATRIVNCCKKRIYLKKIKPLESSVCMTTKTYSKQSISRFTEDTNFNYLTDKILETNLTSSFEHNIALANIYHNRTNILSKDFF